jgi:hypothetical protein
MRSILGEIERAGAAKLCSQDRSLGAGACDALARQSH